MDRAAVAAKTPDKREGSSEHALVCTCSGTGPARKPSEARACLPRQDARGCCSLRRHLSV